MFFARIKIFVQNFNQKENYFFIYFACKSKSLLIYLNTLTFFMCSKSGISLNRIDKNKEKKGENKAALLFGRLFLHFKTFTLATQNFYYGAGAFIKFTNVFFFCIFI